MASAVSSELILNCLLLGKSPDYDVFYIKVKPSEYIRELKKKIEQMGRLQYTAIWKVGINTDGEEISVGGETIFIKDSKHQLLNDANENELEVNIEKDLEGIPLYKKHPIELYWSAQPRLGDIHIIISDKLDKQNLPVDIRLADIGYLTSEYIRYIAITHHTNFTPIGDCSSVLYFLYELATEEVEQIQGIFVHFEHWDKPRGDWSSEVEEVQVWVQRLYNALAAVWGLVVNLQGYRRNESGEVYGDHYLTHFAWSELCCTWSDPVDYTRCYSLEDKLRLNPHSIRKAVNQCTAYSTLFFQDPENRQSIYFSIISSGTHYIIWYAQWRGDDIHCGMTNIYEWSMETVLLVGRVFKTFLNQKLGELRA